MQIHSNMCTHEFILQGGFNILGSLDVGSHILYSLNGEGVQICNPHQCYIFTTHLANNEHPLTYSLFQMNSGNWLTQWYVKTPVSISMQINM